MKQPLHLFLALLTLLFVGCGYDDSAIIDRIENLEQKQNTKIATINEQIEAINNSIASLEVAKTDLDQRIKDAQADANANAEDISELQEAKVTLEERITTLQSYVDNELNNANEWASATFATLEQYNALAEDVAQLRDVIDGLDEVLKNWVNEQLTGYYTIAEVDAMLEALQKSVDENNESLQKDVEELSTKVDNMKAELTDAYTTAIDEAINTNNGVIDGKIAEDIAAVNGRIDSEVAAISARIDALEERIEDLEDALDKIKALDIVFDIENGKACMAGTSIEFGYTIVGGDEDSVVESFGDRGWGADVIATDATSGRIRVTAPKDGGNGKVVVLATSGAGASTMKSIRFEEGILTDIADRYEVDWEACTLAVRFKTNVDYEVRIPAEAQSWLSVADTRAEVRQDTLTFSILENPEDSPARTAVVELISEFGEVLQSFEIAQKMQPAQDHIQFADKYVKKVCVEKFDTNGDGELSYLEASKVTSIGGHFFGDYAPAVKSFDELQYFVNVTLIGSYAFRDCSSLTSITIPEGVMSIRNDAFYNCPSLKRVNISNLSVWYKISFDNCGNPMWNGANLYVNDELVIDIVIPSDIISINPYLFHGCTSIRSVVIPEGVTSIGNAAFSGCSSLSSITIPESATAIGDFTFSGCSSLTSITIPEGVTSIGGYTFHGCSSLTSITIPEGVTSIGGRAFKDCSSLTSITIPEGVVSIGDYAFCDCYSLKSVNIPDGLASIGNGVFCDCYSLTSVNIPDSVTTIGDEAFRDCSSLTSVAIGDSVTTIGEWAFYGCTSLTSVTIHDSVTTIGIEAFETCTSLTSVYCKAITPPSLGGIYVFYDNGSGRKIYVPVGSVNVYKSAEYWSEYKYAIVGYDFENGEIAEIESSNEIWYTSSDGYVVEPYNTNAFGANIISNEYNNGMGVITFDGDVTTIGEYAFRNCPSLSSVTIPDGVTTIGDSAFSWCESLSSVTIPDSVTTIGDSAFNWCISLTSVNIPDSVTTIGGGAFHNCSLTSVNIPDSVTTIGEWAFAGCYCLQEFKGKYATEDGRSLIVDNTIIAYAYASGNTYTIPDSVTTIGSGVFYECTSLTSVNIPDSVTTIGNQAFNSCPSLTSVNIPDSVTTIGHYAFSDCTSLTSVYCKATTPPAMGYDVFFSNGSGRKIYVPTESVDAYKSAYGWSEYASAIVGYDFDNGVVVE